jgi:hypothetical protein
MAKKSDLIYNSLFFLAGVMVCYALSQFSYLKIDVEINVWETLLGIASLGVGLFIAVSLQHRYNKNQNLYNYLVNRLDQMWSKFNALHLAIEVDDKIEFDRITKILTELQRANLEFTKLIDQADYQIIDEFERLSEELQDLFDVCIKNNGVVYYDQKKDQILALNEQIINNYIRIFNTINK